MRTGSANRSRKTYIAATTYCAWLLANLIAAISPPFGPVNSQ
jgi:hypothetical protein